MKTLILLAFATACMAQPAKTGVVETCGALALCGHTSVVVDREPVVRYLVEYSTTEPCYDCNLRFAVVCLPTKPDCGVPTTEVPHFEYFDTKEQAIKFLNDGMYQGGCLRLDNDGVATVRPCAVGDFEITVKYPKTFQRLLEVREVAVRVETKQTEIPQPAVKVETKQYSVK